MHYIPIQHTPSPTVPAPVLDQRWGPNPSGIQINSQLSALKAISMDLKYANVFTEAGIHSRAYNHYKHLHHKPPICVQPKLQCMNFDSQLATKPCIAYFFDPFPTDF